MEPAVAIAPPLYMIQLKKRSWCSLCFNQTKHMSAYDFDIFSSYGFFDKKC